MLRRNFHPEHSAKKFTGGGVLSDDGTVRMEFYAGVFYVGGTSDTGAYRGGREFPMEGEIDLPALFEEWSEIK